MSYNHEATELELYLRNTWEPYQKLAACEANLRKHYRRGNYDPTLALKGFGYPVEAAAKSYAAEYADTGTPWHKLFTVETRREVAQNLLDTFDPAEGE